MDEPFQIGSFKEVKAIYDFDNQTKGILYSTVMQLETTLKNYTIATVVRDGYTDAESIFQTYLNHYKESPNNKYKQRMKIRLQLKRTFDDVIAKNYSSSKIIQHYIHKNELVPLWAIFELITLGDFGDFLLSLNTAMRLNLEEIIGIKDIVQDTDGSMLPRHIFIIKELRNAVAHNGVVFDCRFNSVGVRKSVLNQLEKCLDIANITFDHLIDYLALIVYYQKHFGETKTELHSLVRNFRNATKTLQRGVNKNVFDKIVGTVWPSSSIDPISLINFDPFYLCFAH